jgi:hypothetical protein
MTMRLTVLGATLLALASPAMAKTHAAKAPPPKKEAPAAKGPDFDIGQMMAVLDKLFPAQPDPAPARLALSRTAVQGLLPDGTYARMMDGVMHGVADRVLGLTEADLGKAAGNGKAADTTTLREKMAKDDPNFDERMRIMEKVIGEEFAKMTAIIEPRLREGLARSMARRFDEQQLGDLNAFLATDSGRAFGRQSMAMWVDPDVMRAMISTLPEMMKGMPDAAKRIESETAHLPKPKADKPKPAS